MSTRQNRLADETSPYLQQHAENPVDWYPWGEEALQKARQEDKPIFLSVGYSACHWCHVMERESFEDEKIARVLNGQFVNIKVDREERPELDRIYMDAVQLMSGQGGWPMSVWLTPDLQPFYAGTYFPPVGKWGRAGFGDVLQEVHRVWTEERGRVNSIADQMKGHLQKMAKPGDPAKSVGSEPIQEAIEVLARRFDPEHGGFGEAPKFPASMQCRFLLKVAAKRGVANSERKEALEIAEKTLIHMASGGMYDHLGGGFHRYSVDEQWLVPHFEKMLYDNALLMRAYLEAFEATGRPFYRRIVEEIGNYIFREMVDTGGTEAFFATQDADSEGVEGKFFVWSPDEFTQELGEGSGERAAAYWGVSDDGNFENGKSVLHRLDALDFDEGVVPGGNLKKEYEDFRRALLKAREKRIKPGRDEKIIAAWNGMMIEALAAAGRTLGREDYIKAAEKAATFILETMCVDGRGRGLHRIHKDGRTRFAGSLDDYANMAVALTVLYEATGESRWLDDAQVVIDEMIELFGRPEGGFFYANEDHPDLIVRQIDMHDRAMPSATSRALEALYRIGLWIDNESYQDHLHEGLQAFYPNMVEQAVAMTHMVGVLDAYLEGPLAVVCARSSDGGDTELEESLRQTYLRHGGSVTVGPAGQQQQPAVVSGKKAVNGAATAYLCQSGRCGAPMTTKDKLFEELGNIISLPER